MKKHLHTALLVAATAALFLAGCDGTVGISETDVEEPAALSKAETGTYSYTYDLSAEDPIIECRGELMKFYGILTINIREQSTPSGNLLVKGRVEYPDDHRAEGLDSGIVWEGRKALNPYTETLKGEPYSEEDFWVQNWQIIEWYTNPEHGSLKVHWWGGFKIDDEGNLQVNRDQITCK